MCTVLPLAKSNNKNQRMNKYSSVSLQFRYEHAEFGKDGNRSCD